MKAKCVAMAAMVLMGMTAVSDVIDSGSSSVHTVSASSGVNVSVHSQEEIAEYYASHPFTLNTKDKYDAEPSLVSPYSAGKLSDEAIQNGLNALNFARFIAGLDEVKIKEEYCTLTQAASLVNELNGGISHSPARPSGLPDDLYEAGRQGAGSSNLAYGYSNVAVSVFSGYLSDNYASLLPVMGHRRWCLNPSMQYTGFGEVGKAGAMYSFDNFSGKTDVSGVCWPAQNMPVNFCHDDYIWTYSRGKSVNRNNVKVTFKRLNDSKVWHFAANSSDGDFYVNNDGYGQSGCIIFRPKNLSYKAGDVFEVQITGTDTEIDYTVNFFDLNSVQKGSNETTKGDVDGNGSVTSGDFLKITKYIIGTDRSVSAAAADINEDGKVDVKDAAAIKSVLMK